MQRREFSRNLAIGAAVAGSIHMRNIRGGLQSFAFGYGCIKALIQAVNSEVRS